MPLTTTSTKRRREDSPINYQHVTEIPKLTLDQLKLQYGNKSVNKNYKIDFVFFYLKLIFILGRSIEKTSSNDKKS